MAGELDNFIHSHGIVSRYELAKVTGISQQAWRTVNDRDLEQYTVKQLRALGMATAREPDEVLHELWVNWQAGALWGFRPYLKKYDVHDQKLERQLYDIIDQLAENGQSVHTFTFNRFESELETGQIKDPQTALKQMMRKTIATLRDALKKAKHGEAPIPDGVETYEDNDNN